jgi:hypothetical protein
VPGDDCIVALMDSYYFPLAGDDRALQEWKTDALHVIKQLHNRKCINNVRLMHSSIPVVWTLI